jgi:citrate lyase beta subunit
MNTSLPPTVLAPLAARLDRVNAELARRFPGESAHRQPVHTVYGGAHLFSAETAHKLGTLALASLDRHAATAGAFASAVGLSEALADPIYQRVRDKLRSEPVEDFRIDFEDGYGIRPDDEEDQAATRAAAEVARGLAAGSLPPFIGIRIKPLSAELFRRAWRTLDLFVTTLVDATQGALPPGFVITLPKITAPEQVAVVVDVLAALEQRLNLEPGALRIELMIETTQAILSGVDIAPRQLVDAAAGRCSAAHFGTYDYTASCQITAAHQHMTHESCNFARHVLQVALGQSGIWLSDGATNILPVGPHEGTPDSELSPAHVAANRRAAHRAWKLHFDHVQHSLVHAYYQGWDLHPAQLPTRYAAVYEFFLRGLDSAAERLRTFVDRAAQATLVGEVFDDAATGQGLLNYFLRAINCGAIREDEAVARTGVTLDELRTRSFGQILERRRTAARQL